MHVDHDPNMDTNAPQPDTDALLYGELRDLLNRYSCENTSSTPDFVLAQFMLSCLDAFNGAAA